MFDSGKRKDVIYTLGGVIHFSVTFDIPIQVDVNCISVEAEAQGLYGLEDVDN